MKKRLMSMVLVVLIALGMVACGKESEGTLIYSIPEDFVYDQASGCYVSPDYPYVYTNINYYSQPNDGSFRTLTQRNVEGMFEEVLSAQLQENIDITITRWEKTEIDGYDAIIYSLEYVVSGLDCKQTQVAINGTDNFHYVTFTDYGDYVYEDAFMESISSWEFE